VKDGSGKIFAEGTIPSTRFGSGPGALHSIFAHLPTITQQQRRNSPVSAATVLTGQGNDRFGQRILVDPLDRGIALCSSPLPQQPVRMALTHFVLFARMLHRTTPPLRG